MAKQTTRIEIYNAIWERPMCEVAERFDVSPTTLSRVCQRHDIPAPPRGHWARVSAGFLVSPPPLRLRPDSEFVQFRDHGRKKHGPTKQRDRGRKFTTPAVAPEFADKFRARSPHVALLMARLEQQVAAGKTTACTFGRSEFRISVLPASTIRAARLLDTLCILADAKGIDLRPSQRGLAFASNGYLVALAVTEQIGIHASLGTRLEIRLDNRHYKDGIQRRFVDNGKQCLEDMLSRVVSSIQRCAKAGISRLPNNGFLEDVRKVSDRKEEFRNTRRPDRDSLDDALQELEQALRHCRHVLSADRRAASAVQAVFVNRRNV
jgi:hypothetical protein